MWSITFEEEPTLPRIRHLPSKRVVDDTAQVPGINAPWFDARWPYWVLGAALGLILGSGVLALLFLPREAPAQLHRPRPEPLQAVTIPLAPLEPPEPPVEQPPIAPPAGVAETPGLHTRVQLRKSAPRPAPTGRVAIKSEPWSYIHVDGRPLDRTSSSRPFELPAGRHQIRLVNPVLDLEQSLTVDVKAGELVRRFVRLQNKALLVPTWAEDHHGASLRGSEPAPAPPR